MTRTKGQKGAAKTKTKRRLVRAGLPPSPPPAGACEHGGAAAHVEANPAVAAARRPACVSSASPWLNLKLERQPLLMLQGITLLPF